MKEKKPFSRPPCDVSRVLVREHKSCLVLTNIQVTLPLPAVSITQINLFKTFWHPLLKYTANKFTVSPKLNINTKSFSLKFHLVQSLKNFNKILVFISYLTYF